MKYEGTFNYYIDNESKTFEEILKLVNSKMTVSIKGLNVFYSSPKDEEHQKQNKSVIKDAFEGWYNTPLGKKLLKDITPSRMHIDNVTDLKCNHPFSIFNNKEENMNRLVEEQLERREEKIFKDWECTNLGVLQGATEADWVNSIGNSMKRGKIIKYKPSGTIGIEEITDIMKGKKENKGKPQLSILFTQFPKALEAIAKCSEYGHLKYKSTDADYLNYQRVEGGSKAYADAGLRHRLYKKGTTDVESKLPHYYHVAWNALAELELLIKENSK
jgi:hypothetical protein